MRYYQIFVSVTVVDPFHVLSVPLPTTPINNNINNNNNENNNSTTTTNEVEEAPPLLSQLMTSLGNIDSIDDYQCDGCNSRQKAERVTKNIFVC